MDCFKILFWALCTIFAFARSENNSRRLDSPAYLYKMAVLEGYQANQSHYVKAVFKSPATTNFGFSRYPGTNDMIMLWRSIKYKETTLPFTIASMVNDSHFNASISGLLKIYPQHNASLSYTYHANVGDARLFVLDGQLKVLFVDYSSRWQKEVIADVFLDKARGQLYVTHWTDVILGRDKKLPNRHEKNWSPFVWENKSTSPPSSQQMFVDWINPHKVARTVNETDDSMRIEIESTSEVHIAPGERPFWEFGSPHGGTNVILIDTQYGPRYLHVFHSSGKFLDPEIVSYYMGAYLFEVDPPFRITHMTPHPIIPKLIYNETTSGWSYKAIDYIVFPTGLLSQDGTLYVGLGRHDREGWILSLNQTLFVASFRELLHLSA